MANTYTALHYHFTFSTKNRRPWIKAEIEERVWSYLGGIARKNKLQPVKIGGIEDHVHVLVGAPATIAPAKIAQLIKGGSSAWIHDEFPELVEFAWQDGYAVFTVSKSAVPDAWWNTHKNKSLRDIQITVLEWTIAEEEKRLADYSPEERDYLKTKLRELRKSKDALAAGWPFVR